MRYLNKFYLDKEKDIIVSLYKEKEDEIIYIIETPNHHTGNLITSLAKVCNTETIKNNKDMKIIKGIIPAYVVGNSNEDIYILTLGGVEVAIIYQDGRVEQRIQIPAIIKTFMSQTKDYTLGIEKTLVSAYIQKKIKLRTDLHTHQNANLSPDCLIALGIKHELRYPLYYIKKINLKITKQQEEKILNDRAKIEKEYEISNLQGKYLTRKIDDNTFINFADLILNNIENAEENISKIRKSLAILKDGQAVFTNLEKVYQYRYIFSKGISSEKRIGINKEKINQIPEIDIRNILNKMLEDSEKKSIYCHNNLREDKLLWIAREYQKQGVEYVEITDTDLTKPDKGIEIIEQIHEIIPKIEEETGVKIRFLAGIRRIPLTIIKDQETNHNYLRENLDIIKTLAKSPYVVGSDFIGEEINDISELQPVITELVQYAVNEDNGFTIRIHAGENDSLRNNVGNSIDCIINSLKPGQKIPRFRIGHGLYSADLRSQEGQELIEKMKKTGAIIEFQLTSNVRLNNLNKLDNHPIKIYINSGVKCLQGTDGCGFYGIDSIDEQLALMNLIGLKNEEVEKMRKVEEELINYNKEYFEIKNKKFQKFLSGKTIKEALTKLQEENLIKGKQNTVTLRINDKIEAEKELKDKIKPLPLNKFPIIIAGGSFNAQGTITNVNDKMVNKLEDLIKSLDETKIYFVIGHKMEAYERVVLDTVRKLKKDFEIYAFIPKMISKQEKKEIEKQNLTGIRICIEPTEFGIYKSFNYEIFERRESIVIAFSGNSPVSNLVQEAKNGKGKAKIFVSEESEILKEKAKSLGGYVQIFRFDEDLKEKVIKIHPEIEK